MTFQSSSFYVILQLLAPCFTVPSFQNFATVAVGLILCRDRHYISQAVRVCVSLGVSQHHSVFYRFFSRARWAPDELGKLLFRRLLRFVPDGSLTAILDDTLCRKTGPHIWGAGMHHDAVASSYGRNTGHGRHVAFAFGHSWVILALWVPFPWSRERGVAIPILFRLYRSKKLSPSAEYRKRTLLAVELLQVLAAWTADTGRDVMVVGDSEYSCRTVIKQLPARFQFTGPLVMNAALFTIPEQPKERGRGCPRKKGDRLPPPAKMLADPAYPWVNLTVVIYGRPVEIRIKTLVCQWYQVAGSRPVRVVITRDPTGRIDDRAYVCTDSTATVEQVLGVFSRRWSLEVTFYNTKQYLGLEHPQNGWGYLSKRRRQKKKPGPQPRANKGKLAVERTVPCVLYLYGLIHLWYFEHGDPKADVALARRLAPWYTQKRTPSFADVLDALRRHLISILEFSKDPVPTRVRQQFPGAPDPLMAAA